MFNVFRPNSWIRSRTSSTRPSDEDVAPGARATDGSIVDEAAAPVDEANELAAASRPLGERIEELAYRRWCEQGCPDGRDLDFWLAAEREILAEIHDGPSSNAH